MGASAATGPSRYALLGARNGQAAACGGVTEGGGSWTHILLVFDVIAIFVKEAILALRIEVESLEELYGRGASWERVESEGRGGSG